MLRNKKTKVFALALSVIMLVLAFVPYDPTVIGLRLNAPASCLSYKSCWSYGSLAYSFFHANLLHWFLNTWCFLSCVFIVDVSFRKLLLAYLIACSVPALSSTPTIGFSGVCFALLGMVMWQSANRRCYNIIIGVTVLVTFILCPKAVNSLLHVYCYILGVASVPVFNGLRHMAHTHNL